MITKTLFYSEGKFETGEVEVKLLPGIPQLHVVGLPDASIKECGIKLKSALKSSGLDWPTGQQIVVSLRPNDFRKSGAGVELAIALCYLGVSGQLSPEIRECLRDHFVWGEVALNGEVMAPAGFSQALASLGDIPLISGKPHGEVREGTWWELSHLEQKKLQRRQCNFDFESYWTRPELPNLLIHEKAAEALLLTVHMELSALVAGPQGTGKTTWARLAHALSPPPDLKSFRERTALFGEEVWRNRWRPIEQPHHTVTAQAMIGGGLPLMPGVISRAHGGMLIMDEFLEFNSYVLEALREPIESGVVELARKGVRERFPARFQLIATSNLCPCGKLNPEKPTKCNLNLARCRGTVYRLSGPLLDRFEILVLSHEWLGIGRWLSMDEIVQRLDELALMRRHHNPSNLRVPGWIGEMGLSHRRRRAILRLARGLADLEGSERVRARHYSAAFDRVVKPMLELRELFG